MSRLSCVLCYVFIAIFSHCSVRGDRAQLDSLMTGIQNIGLDLSKTIAEAYQNRCEYLARGLCQCSYHPCAADALFEGETAECNNDKLGFLDKGRCGEGCPNVMKIVPDTFLTLPPGTTTIDGFQPSDPLIVEDLCYMNNIGSNINGTLPLLKELSADYLVFYGSRSGATSYAPGRALGRKDKNNPVESCEAYDPRSRPWYQAASSGPKDVVFVLDVSGSMQKGGSNPRIELLRSAVSNLISTLGSSDYFEVVKFSTSASTLDGSATLVKATQENKDRFIDIIQTNLNPAGSTNFNAAFTETFDLLERSYEAGVSSNCARAIVFITDGQPDCVKDCADNKQCNCAQPILDNFNQKQQQILDRYGGTKPILFTFAMGGESDDNIPRQLVCQNLLSAGGGGGSFGVVDEGENPLAQMSSYISYLGMGRSSNTPVWSEIYRSFSASVDVVTMSLPVKDPESKAYVGTVGVDVLASIMYDLVDGNKEEIVSVIDNYRSCQVEGRLDVTKCDVQLVRNRGFECVDRLPSSDCYKSSSNLFFVSTDEVPFDMAVDKCRQLSDGGKLAAPTDENINAFVASISPVEGAWIGYTTSAGWIDAGTNVDFTSWASNEPSSKGICAKVNPRGALRNWQVDFCGRPSRYICEIPEGDISVCSNVFDLATETNYKSDWPKLSQCATSDTVGKTCDANTITGQEVLCTDAVKSSLSLCETLCCGECGQNCPLCEAGSEYSFGGCEVESSLSTGAIVGIVIGAVLAVVLIATIVWLIIRARKSSYSEKNAKLAGP